MSANILPRKCKRVIKVRDKVVGYVQGNTFTKTAASSKHKLRQPPAWAIDAEAFDKEVKPNATKISVVDKETGLVYLASVEKFERLKGELDRGFGRQYYLTLDHWEVQGSVSGQLLLWGGDSNA